ncbi:MAG TPA: hypothetical protein P5191_01420 [Ruminococcus sp.]|nr:hypothetical protein [Ruminococcus sp.]
MGNTTVRCGNCGGILELKDGLLYCSYCGAKLKIYESDDVKIANKKYDTYRNVELERAKYKFKGIKSRNKAKVNINRDNNQHELDMELVKNSHELKEMIMLVGFIMLLGLLVLIADSKMFHKGQIKIPKSASSYKGDNYEEVEESMKALGFTDIETIKVKDVVVGIVYQKGDVKK